MSPLVNAFLTVRGIETSALRLTAFEDIAAKNRSIGLVYGLHRRLRNTPIGAVMLLLYGLKCFLTVRPANNARHASLLCLAAFPNEHAAIEGLKHRLPNIALGDLSLRRSALLHPASWIATWRFITLSRVLYKLARRCSKGIPFMPACRSFSTVTYYLRFLPILRASDPKGVVIANHYSPECTALAAAARALGLRVVFINHSHFPAKIPWNPPPRADLAILTSEAAWKRYRGDRATSACHVLIGYDLDEMPLRLDLTGRTHPSFGIFLTGLTDKAYVHTLAQELHAAYPGSRILLRPHPVSLVNEDFSALLRESPFVKLSPGTRLGEDIAACDIALCGNSSVVIETLKGGCPVVYDHRLDRLPFDYNGFVEAGLVIPIPADGAISIAEIMAFYKRTDWSATMLLFDAGYRQDKQALSKQAETEVTKLIEK